MPMQRDNPILWKQVHHARSYLPSMMVLSAVALIALGTGIIVSLPEPSDNDGQAAHQGQVASAATNGSSAVNGSEANGSSAINASETTATADDSLCDKQAWPYIDQRCAEKVEAARGTRQVRIVTDKGNSVTVRTPVPIVEAKPKPAPRPPVVAQAEKLIGPPVVPTVAEPPLQSETKTGHVAAAPQQPAPVAQDPAPQAAPAPAHAPAVQQAVMTPSAPPPATNVVAPETQNPSDDTRDARAKAAIASAEPPAPDVDAAGDLRGKKSKAARAAKRAEKREAKRRKAMEENGDVPEEVIATVKSLRDDDEPRRRRARRNAVPDEVVSAVEEAMANEPRRGRRIVIVGSGGGNQRIYLVPREQVGRW